jgi:DivIVA domain-containing protein
MNSGTSGEWPTRTSPITPEDIRSATFHLSPIAWRGYAAPDVKRLLDAAADALQETREETVGLEAEVDRLRNFYRTHSGSALSTPGHEGYNLLAHIREYAPSQVQQACDYADQVIDRAPDIDRTLKQARVRTSIVIEEATRRLAGHTGMVEANQAQLWIRYFARALRAYTSAVYDTIGNALARAVAADQPDPHRGHTT